jgi:hypothetical protein
MITMTNSNVLSCFSDADGQRISRTFDHLLPHIVPDEYAVVGGLVIRYVVAETRVKVDLFAWPVREPTIANVACRARALPFQSPEDQLAKTI